MNPNFFNKFVVKKSTSRRQDANTQPSRGYIPRTGFPPRGFPPQGFPQQAFQPRGFPPRGFPPRGFPPRGFPPREPPTPVHGHNNHHNGSRQRLAPPFVPKPNVDAGLLKRIQHTARYLVANPYFFETLRTREGRNPKFAFLFDMSNQFHPYFRWYEHATKSNIDPDLNPYDLKNMTVGTMATRGQAHVDSVRQNYVPMNPMAAIPTPKQSDRDRLDSRIKEFYDKIKSR